MDEMATNQRYDFSPTARDKAWGCYVSGTGCRLVPPRARYQVFEPGAPVQWGRGRILRDYGVVYITHGRGMFGTRAGGETRVAAGDLLLLLPGVWHNYYPLAPTGWDEHWVLFNGAHVAPQMMSFFAPLQSGVLHPGVSGPLHELFVQLRIVAEADAPYANQMLAGLTMQILATTLSCLQVLQEPRHQEESVIQKAKGFLDDHWDQAVDMHALAGSLNLSYRHFRRLFKSSTGLPPQQYLMTQRVNHAKKLLEDADLKISDIARRSGFADPYYFSRIFQQKTGCWPSQWHQ